MAEIVNRLLALALLTNNHVHPQPVQGVFAIEVCTASPGVPRLGSEIKLRRGVGSVLQIAPLPPGKVIELCGGDGEIVAILFGGEQPAAGCKHKSQVVGQSLINPQEIVLHGCW